MISATNYSNAVSSLINIFSSSFKTLLNVLTLSDYIFFGVILFLIIILIVLLFLFKNSDRNLEWETKDVDPDNELLAIAREIEANDESMNIDLTSYEREAEEAAIISYDELVKRNKNCQIAYSDVDKNDEISIKKIDINGTNTNLDNSFEPIKNTTRSIMVMSYDKEEALLNALKQLQKNLS